MISIRAFLASLSSAMIVAAVIAVLVILLIHEKAKVEEYKAKAEAALLLQQQAEERAGFAAKQIGFVQEVARRALTDREAAEAKIRGFANELARVKKEAGKHAAVIAAGSGSSAPLPGGPGLFAQGDTGRFHLQLGAVRAEHGTIAVATWAQAFNDRSGALLFEGSVPLQIDYTPPEVEPARLQPGYGLFAGCAWVGGKAICGMGPGAAFAPWEAWKFRAQLSGGVGLWPNLTAGATLLGSMK